HPEVVGGVAGALVVADADQPCGGDTHLVVPDGVGLVVFGVDRHPELVGIQAQPVTGGEKLPGVEDGVPPAVAAKAEIAEHLKKGVMAGGITDVLEVVVLAPGAHTALGRRGAGVVPVFVAEKGLLELYHPRIGEQQGGIIARHQAAAGHYGVTLGGKKIEKCLTDLCAFHSLKSCCRAAWDGRWYPGGGSQKPRESSVISTLPRICR